MKKHTPLLPTRSLSILGFACTLAALPLASSQAQTTPTVPTSPGQVDTTSPDATGLKETQPKSSEPVAKGATKLSGKDERFMNKAGAGNSAEVQLAELAQKNAESPAVKAFAEKMISDHKAANESLDAIAKSHGISTFNPIPKDEDKATFAQMSSLTGTAFDTAYAKHAVSDHEMDLKEYKAAKLTVKDPALSAYVDKTEAIVAEHLKMARELVSKKAAVANH